MTTKYYYKIYGLIVLLWIVLACGVSPVLGQETQAGSTISAGDTAWILTSSALVLAMTIPGLALFYGGMVRNKNVLSTMMHSFISVCVVSVVWVLWGYTIAFGSDVSGLIGSFEFLGLNGVGGEPLSGGSIPHAAFMVFQLMFAGITVALISGAIAERMKFSAFVLFGAIWVTVIYAPSGSLGLGRWVADGIR